MSTTLLSPNHCHLLPCPLACFPLPPLQKLVPVGVWQELQSLIEKVDCAGAMLMVQKPSCIKLEVSCVKIAVICFVHTHDDL
jgi:hypothetical protein